MGYDPWTWFGPAGPLIGTGLTAGGKYLYNKYKNPPPYVPKGPNPFAPLPPKYVPSKRSYKRKRSRPSGQGGPYTGKMVPSLSWGKSTLRSKPSLVVHREQVGTSSDPDVVYLGLGPNYERIFRDFCKCVIAAILAERKIAVVNWDNPCNINGIVELVYYQDAASTGTTTATALTFTNVSTANTMASSLYTFFQTLVNNVHKFKEIRMTDTSNAAVTLPVQMSASNLKIQINCYQTLLVQNQTLGSTADATAAASSGAISSNPLYVGVFDANSNIVYQKDRSNINDASWEPWAHWDDAFPEVIVRTAASQFVTGTIPNQVSNIFANAKQTYKAILQPGEMKKINLTHNFSGYFNSLMKQFQDISTLSHATIMPMAGKQRILAFDKMIDQTTTPVNVAWELNQKIIGRFSYKKITNTVPQYE